MLFKKIAIALCLVFLFYAPSFATSIDPRPKSGTRLAVSPSPAVGSKRVFPTLPADGPRKDASVNDFVLKNLMTPVSQEELILRQKIEATFSKVTEEKRFVDFLDENSLIDLPVGIKVELGVLTYIILIDSVIIAPTECFLFASMQFEDPVSKKKVHFLGSDIRFSRTGGLTGDGKLLLVGDYDVPIDANNKFIIRGSAQKTFVEFDCRGYKQFSLDASLAVSKTLLVPEINGKVDTTKNVEINFVTTIVDWSDILVTVNVPKFQVKGVKDVTFTIQDAVLDFSDQRNPPAIRFPTEYTSQEPGFNQNLWRGVYLRDLTVTLPPQFEKPANTTTPAQLPATAATAAPVPAPNRISFSATDVILDHVGFSGRVSASNLIPLDKGKIGKWQFSMEYIYVDIAANQIREGGFRGKLNIPISKKSMAAASAQNDQSTQPDTTALAPKPDSAKLFLYTAMIREGGDFLFSVSNAETVEFDLWKAHVILNPSSYVEIKMVEGKFSPKAVLHGEMTMKIGLKDDGEATGDESKNVKLAKVTFESLEIQSVKPYLKVGNFSLGTEGEKSGMGGFPISINGISAITEGDEIALGIDLTLSLVGEKDGGFAASGKFNIVAQALESSNDLSYKFKKLELERFSIDIDKGSFKFKGTLNFYKNDPVYGNGISGTVDATFEPTFKLQASAIFGTKDGVRYWFADALVTFQNGVPIFPSVAFYSFGGGAYYKMKIDDQGVGSPLGRTVSGITYVPDPSIGFGFKATMSLGIQPGKQSFNAEATYEMAFNASGGVRYINFRGNGYFMTPPIPNDLAKLQEKASKLASVTKREGQGAGNLNEGAKGNAISDEIYGTPAQAGEKAQVWASTMINYDFENRTLHGNLKAYINVGDGLITGAGPGNLAGEAVLHFAPGEWYIYIGRPEYENRFAIQVMGLARLDAYFVIGSIVPDSPPPPANVSAILGGIDLDYMKDLNALEDGAGVGFGASFRVDTGDITFLMFYGRFAAGLGFDIMLKDYGDVRCRGTGRLGINGWYANAQAYAYFEGKIGIQVRIWRKNRKIEILDIGAAVVAQAKMPNPTWVKGIAGGRFSVLGGLVKGKCSFDIEIGKECEMITPATQTSPLEAVEVLAQTTPQENAQGVDVFTVPQAIFNYEMEKEYEMTDANDQIIKFKIAMDAFAIKDNGTPINAQLEWNDDHTVAALNPYEILPSEKDLSLEVTVSFKEKQNGYWITAMSEGERLSKTYMIKFKTAKAPDHIPESNVAYSYPVSNQFNFYKSETPQAYIMLKQGQAYLFESSADWRPVVRMKTASGVVSESPFQYNTAAKEVTFSIPPTLINNQIYEMKVVNAPLTTLSSIDANVDTSSYAATSGDAVALQVTTRSADRNLEDAEEKELYKAYFRTSQYNTVREKLAAAALSSGWRSPVLPGVHNIGSNFGGTEPFSQDEMNGGTKFSPLIQIEADLSSVPWFNDRVHPLIYEGYPLQGSIHLRPSLNRDPEILGVIPAKAVVIYQYPSNIQLTGEHISSGMISMTQFVGRIDYKLAPYMYYDYLDMASQAANHAIAYGSNARLDKLMREIFPVIRGGDYWITIRYNLPGRTTSSSYRHKINNPID
jgi:hypothetical protein